MPLPPDLAKPAFSIFPEKADRVIAGNCVTCENSIGEFRDSLSKKEYSISGMCQSCQDSVFGEPEPHDDFQDW
tara:strand:+ start:626 stop:844 length:219 start_codon:yes stop_codon:yes gene_type:complete